MSPAISQYAEKADRLDEDSRALRCQLPMRTWDQQSLAGQRAWADLGYAKYADGLVKLSISMNIARLAEQVLLHGDLLDKALLQDLVAATHNT